MWSSTSWAETSARPTAARGARRTSSPRRNRILRPYTIDVKEVVWWSIYDIGHRMTDKFDDVPRTRCDRNPRVLLAGDACHTHSPRPGRA
jgi:2-polyprenyl-6-methoxyphenol hydroxylase-like FAD-dependent oxidoreductase